MKYIDHHAHMVSRTTDDYQQMALTGCVAVTEPAFWAGWDRSHADGFEDYFRQLTEFEPKRAAQYHIQHYTWLAMNPKEADDRVLSREVLKRIPKFLDRPDGARHRRDRPQPRHAQRDRDLHRAGRAGARAQAADPDPHAAPRGQAQGHEDLGRRPAQLPDARAGRVMVDHAEEHTLELILDHGYWAGLTLYPQTKVSAQRAADMIERFGPDRICVAGACDWGPSDPMAVPRFIMEMRRRKHPEALIHRVVFENPVQFLSQSAEVHGLPAGASGRPRRRPRLIAGGSVARLERPARYAVHRFDPVFTSPTARTSTPPTAGTACSPTFARYAPALKARFSPAAPFGVGLRLSAREARELLDGRSPARVPRVPRSTKGCTSPSSTAFPTARSTARRSRPTSTRPTGATLHASTTRST